MLNRIVIMGRLVRDPELRTTQTGISIRHHLGAAAIVAIPILPVTDLEPALHHGHAALGHILADELRRLPPSDHIDKIGVLLRQTAPDLRRLSPTRRTAMCRSKPGPRP